MAPIKHHAPWQCSQSTCSQVQPNTFNKPLVSLVAPIDNYGHVFVQIEQKQIQALFHTGASISCISQHLLHKIYKNPELSSSTYTDILVDGWLRMGLLPPPREFCRHILSCRELKAESFKRCLRSVLRGVSL